MTVSIPVRLELRAEKAFDTEASAPEDPAAQEAALAIGVEVTGLLSDLIVALERRHGVTLRGRVQIANVVSTIGEKA